METGRIRRSGHLSGRGSSMTCQRERVFACPGSERGPYSWCVDCEGERARPCRLRGSVGYLKTGKDCV